MALPPGIQAKTVSLGIASFADGSLAQGRATISLAVNVLHTPSNRPIFSSDITKPFVDGIVTFDLLPTDAPGLNRIDWSYTLRVEIQGANVQPDVLHFLLPTAGPDTVDLDGLVTVPSSAGIPISVDVLTAADVDPTLASVITPGGSATAAALAADPALRAAFVPVGQTDLIGFLPAGQMLPNDGIADASPLLQVAADQLYNLRAVIGPQQIRCAPGTYRIATQLLWKPGVGISGAGRQATTFKPEARQAFIYGAFSTTVSYDDCVFTDFTVDGTNQTHTAPDYTVKAFYIQRMARARFERVTVLNTWATGFGVDFLRDSWFVDCLASGCGRQGGSRVDTGAGFGFATGYSDVENTSVINCTSVNNWTFGFFSEYSSRGTYPRSLGLRLVGCYAAGNWAGFMDAGSDGAQITGCQLVDNLFAGVLLVTNAASPNAGTRGRVSASTIARNGFTNNGGGLVAAEGADGISYTVSGSDLLGNRVGVLVRSAARITVDGNQIADSAGAGVRVSPVTSTQTAVAPIVPGLRITGNVFARNGKSATEARHDAISIEYSCDRPTISRNQFYDDQATPTQLVAIGLRGPFTTVAPRITGNDFAGVPSDGIVREHTVTDVSFIATNQEEASPAAVLVTNRITNPSAEVATSGVGTSGLTVSRPTVGDAHSGTAVLRCTTTVATWAYARYTAAPVTAGETITLSAWVRGPAGRLLAAYAFWTVSDYARGALVTATGTWQRVSVTAVVPAGYTTVQVGVGRVSGGGSASGDVIDLDDLMITSGEYLFDYFDGATNGGAWTGAANASTSTKSIAA